MVGAALAKTSNITYNYRIQLMLRNVRRALIASSCSHQAVRLALLRPEREAIHPPTTTYRLSHPLKIPFTLKTLEAME